jgi:serine/threonine-protein kinase
MGAVYEAKHALLNKRVALKTLHGSAAHDPALLERFLREAELAARVRHPHVVDIYDAGVEEGVPFLVMEFLEGEDLARYLEREGRLLAREAVDIVVPLIAGLAELHRLGIAHRDVKPENVFLAYDAHGNIVVKLIDFGVSKDLGACASERPFGVELVGSARGRRGPFEGTPHYMAPEQMRGEAELDARSDQYALGVVLYQCLAGRLPYEGRSLLELAYHVCNGEHVPLRELRPDLPSALLALVERAMSRDLAARFPSMEALGLALLPFASPPLRALYDFELSSSRRSSLPPSRRPSRPATACARGGEEMPRLGHAATLPARSWRPAGRGHALALSFLFAALLSGAGVSGWVASRTSALSAAAHAEPQAQEIGGVSFEHVLLGKVALLF